MMCSRTKVDLDPRNDVYVRARARPAGHAQAIHTGKKEAKFVLIMLNIVLRRSSIEY